MRKRPYDQMREFIIPHDRDPEWGPAYLIKLMKRMYEKDPELRADIKEVMEELVD